MRNFSSVVPTSCTYLVPFDLMETNPDAVSRYQDVLLKAFETRSFASMSSTECQVMGSFLDWVRTLPSSRGFSSRGSNAAFVYSNFNTGITLVFVVDYGYGETGLGSLL